MNKDPSPGDYLRSVISDVPADLKSTEALNFKKTIKIFPEEAVYIYSFKQNKMIYADGWEEILGYKNNEITLPLILITTSPEYAAFSSELNEKALLFINNKTDELEKYSFTMELKKIHNNGSQVPLITRVGVFQAENGELISIIGRFQINRSINLGKVMRYACYGPDKSDFEDEIDKQLFHHYAISDKEKEALLLVSKGFSFKEIAGYFKVSQSAIEKRIIPLYKKFDVRSLTHLVSFAYDNHILP